MIKSTNQFKNSYMNDFKNPNMQLASAIISVMFGPPTSRIIYEQYNEKATDLFERFRYDILERQIPPKESLSQVPGRAKWDFKNYRPFEVFNAIVAEAISFESEFSSDKVDEAIAHGFLVEFFDEISTIYNDHYQVDMNMNFDADVIFAAIQEYVKVTGLPINMSSI